jgi:diguanylate cyclase
MDGDDAIRVTVSIGVAAYPDVDIADEKQLVDLADKALYQAKESVRNRIVTS